MNPYLRNLNRIEFLVTLGCTGRCRHCSEGERRSGGEFIRGDVGAEMVRKICGRYQIQSLMTFGGEPLLHPEAVCRIHTAGQEQGIPKRQLITNGFFSRDAGRIAEVAAGLAECGVNDILLSVDAFHQEFIPLEPVKLFAGSIRELGVPLRTHPAWLVAAQDENPYNRRTREVLKEFEQMGISCSSGNVIFPSGNALKYLSEYFVSGEQPENPYEEDPGDVRSVCISPNGDVLGGNAYQTDIAELLESYTPRREAE